MATVALSGIITPTNVVTATSTTTLTNKTLTGAVMNGTLGATTPTTVVATTVTASTTIGVGAATPSASGAGITFPATQSASTNANTLDDYEEGTWTPVMRGDSTAGTYTGTFSGTYTKIGNVVTVTCVAQPSTTASGGSGYFQITGLPFSNAVHSNGSVMFNSVNFTDTAKFLTGQFISSSGQTTIQIKEVYDNATSADLSIGAFSTSSYLQMTLTYFTS